MSAKQLRHRFIRQFAGMTKYPRATAWLIFALYPLQIVGSVVVGHLLLSQPVGLLSVAGLAILAVFIATRLRGMNNIIHECSHATFSQHLPDNALIGSLCAVGTLGCFRDYRDEHMTHHAHLGDYEHDLDLQGLKDLRIHEPLTRNVVLRHLTNPLMGRHLPYYFRVNLGAKDGRAFQRLKYALLAVVATLALAAPVTTLVLVIVPFALIFTSLNYWTDCLDHAGICASDDELDASRNVLAPLPLRVLFFPRNDSFHLVHHLFPQIPARHLAQSHRVLCEDPVYLAKSNAVHPFSGPREHHPEANTSVTI
jgi:fatty acid desaturase